MTSRRFRTSKYTTREVPSLKKHRDPSSTLVILVISQLINSKWSKLVLIEYKHMLTYQGTVGGHIYWSQLMVYVTKGNRYMCLNQMKLHMEVEQLAV